MGRTDDMSAITSEEFVAQIDEIWRRFESMSTTPRPLYSNALPHDYGADGKVTVIDTSHIFGSDEIGRLIPHPLGPPGLVVLYPRPWPPSGGEG